ncbi:MAG: response regulator [Oscillospiraceae bacterium]|nr:response regulator [Oscillospiraceae bacterium]
MYKVLFAEDEALMRMAFSKMMDWDNSGFQLAAVVANGAEALSYIEKNKVDVLITDLKMPVMDGLELIEALKERSFRGVILVLSNYTDFELVRKALTRGAADYMLKLNIDGEALLKQLNEAAEILKGEKAGNPRQRGDSPASDVFFYPSQHHIHNRLDMKFDCLPESFSASKTAAKYISLYYGQGAAAAEEYMSTLMSRCAALPVHPPEAKAFFIATAQKIAAAVHGDINEKRELDHIQDAGRFLSELCAWLSALLEEARLPQFLQFALYKKEVRDALLFIHFHFTEKITLDDVAKAVNLNRNYLCRLFKQETGVSMFAYLNDLRMKKAAALIEAGDTYMRGVAAAVGIDDQFYFARVFKKYHKVPPSKYGKPRGKT